MIERDNPRLSISRQCELLDISRAAYYYQQRESRAEADLEDLKRIMEVLREIPFYGYRKISRALMGEHPHLTRKRVRRIMRRFGLRALYARRSLSKPRKEHKPVFKSEMQHPAGERRRGQAHPGGTPRVGLVIP